MISQYNLDAEGISSFIVSEESGHITLVSGTKIIICKVVGDKIYSLMDLVPKGTLTIPQNVKLVKTSELNI